VAAAAARHLISPQERSLLTRYAIPTLVLATVALAAAPSLHAQKKSSTPRSGAGSPPTPRVSEPSPAIVAVDPAPRSTAPRSVAESPAAKPADRDESSPGQRAKFGFTGGMAAPMSDLGNTFGVGFSAGAFVEGRPAGFPLGMRSDVQYGQFGGKGVIKSFSTTQITGDVVFDFPSGKRGIKSPFFAVGGLGLYRQSLAGEEQTDFGQNLGAGFNFRNGPKKPFIEGRFHFFNDVEYFALSVGFRL
jgi:hypothetical protein